MIAEVISIGDELLIGQITNTNAAYLSQQLTKLSVHVKWVTTIGDDAQDIKDALRIAKIRANIIITTGGLGPTHDDISKKVICQFFNDELVLDKPTLKNIENIFRKMGRPVDRLNSDQAMVPGKAIALRNRVGTAPGMYFKQENFHLFVLPGVPMEMEAIFKDHIHPLIKQLNKENFIKMSTIKTIGIFESKLFGMVEDLVAQFRSTIEIAFLPTASGVNIRLITRGRDEADCRRRLENSKELFCKRLGQNVYGFDEYKIEELVAKLLLDQKKTLSIADAATGGILPTKLFAIKKSASFLKGSMLFSQITTFPMTIKVAQKQIVCEPTQIEAFCFQVASEIRISYETDYGLFLLSDISPDDGTFNVHFVLTEGRKKLFKTYNYRTARTDNSARIANFALNMLRLALK